MGSAELSNFGPLDKDDAVPTVRKAEAREMRWRPSRYSVQPPMSLTRPDVMRGPRYFDRPRAGTPVPSPHSFPGWARRSVGERRACAMGSGRRPFKFRPLDFGPR
jgi:hypothetical protein